MEKKAPKIVAPLMPKKHVSVSMTEKKSKDSASDTCNKIGVSIFCFIYGILMFGVNIYILYLAFPKHNPELSCLEELQPGSCDATKVILTSIAKNSSNFSRQISIQIHENLCQAIYEDCNTQYNENEKIFRFVDNLGGIIDAIEHDKENNDKQKLSKISQDIKKYVVLKIEPDLKVIKVMDIVESEKTRDEDYNDIEKKVQQKNIHFDSVDNMPVTDQGEEVNITNVIQNKDEDLEITNKIYKENTYFDSVDYFKSSDNLYVTRNAENNGDTSFMDFQSNDYVMNTKKQHLDSRFSSVYSFTTSFAKQNKNIDEDNDYEVDKRIQLKQNHLDSSEKYEWFDNLSVTDQDEEIHEKTLRSNKVNSIKLHKKVKKQKKKRKTNARKKINFRNLNRKIP